MNNERKISPKEFSDKRKSQDDEILKKQLELREREIALKEKVRMQITKSSLISPWLKLGALRLDLVRK